MASKVLIMAQCDKLKNANSMDDAASIITDYPELIFSQLGITSILQAIPKILARSNEQEISYYFIRSIINGYRIKMLGGFNVAHMPTLDGYPIKSTAGRNDVNLLPVADAYRSFDHDWAYHILSSYMKTLILKTDGGCLRGDAVMKTWDPNIAKHLGITSPYAFIGWILFCFDYTAVTIDNDRAYALMVDALNHNGEFFGGFFEVFCGICGKASNDAVNALKEFFRVKDFYFKEPLVERDPSISMKVQNCMMYKLRNCDVGWFQEELDSVIGVKLDLETKTAATDVWVTLAGTLQNYFTTVNFFFEYITEIAYYYPLSKQREDIAERYKRYFHDSTFEYMADITTSVIDHVAKLENYRDQPAERAVTRLVLLDIEKILFDIRAKYPDVTADVMRCFLKDVFNAFGRGFRGFAEGLSWFTDEIVAEVWNISEKATESQVDFISMFSAMEAEDEPSGAVGNGSLHRNASTNKAGAAMKTAERKVFNAYHKYKAQEEKVDQTLSNGINALKKAITGDQQAILIEGKKFSPIGFFKKVLLTIGIFNYSKIAGILSIIVSSVMKGKAKKNEKRKLLMELEEELEMVNEKIEDARGDGNRQAKYDLMRTRNALQNAIKRLKYGIGAETTKDSYHPERLRSTQNYEDRSLRG